MTKPTTAFQIFNTPYLVRIASHFLYSKEYMEVMGVYSSGDKLRDRIAMEEKRSFYSSINGMVEYHARGAVVELVNPDSDAVAIYRLVRDLLNEWANIMEMVGAPEPPLADLQKMEAFVEGIYPIASRYLLAGEGVITPWDEKFNTRGGGGRVLFGRGRQQVKDDDTAAVNTKALDIESGIAPRQSVITESISRSAFYKNLNKGV